MRASKETLQAVAALSARYRFEEPRYGSRAPKLYRLYRRRDGAKIGEEYYLSRLVAVAHADMAAQNSVSSPKF